MAKKYELISVGFGSFTDSLTGEVKEFASGFFVETRKILTVNDGDRVESGFKVHKLKIVKDDGSFEPDLSLAAKFSEVRLSDQSSLSVPVTVEIDIDMSVKEAKPSICGLILKKA